ncbi:hypothetical protein H320_00690, partial [Vibrio parahaemolyticus 49]
MFKENAKKVETIIKTSEEPQSSRLNGFQRLKECCFIVGVLSSVLLAVALFTFSPADPSWSQTAWGGEIDNAGGLFGAWLADTLFFTFGSLAYPIPFLLAAAAWVICRKRGEDEPIDFMLWGTRLLGLTVLIMTSCGLADINFDDIWYFSSGGVVGDVLSSLALPTLNVLGTTLVLLFLWGAGFTLFTGISWLNIVEWLGDRSLAVLAAIANKFRGSEQETLEPQLDEFVEDKVSTKHVEDDQQDDETLPHLTAYEVEEPKEKAAVHEYPIYMPQAKSETSTVKPTPEPQPQRVAAVNATPTYVEPEPQLKTVSTDNVDPMVERTKQLNVTIEELEAAAQQADDWASEEQTSQSYADTNAVYQEQVQAKHEEVVEHDTPQRESSYEEYEQFAAQQEQQLHVEPTLHEEPVIDTRALDDITDHTEPSEHIEPTISDFDVVDEEEAYVAPQPQSRSPEPQPMVQPQSVSQIQPEQTPEPSVVFEPAPQEVEVEEVQDGDQDVAAFQSMVSSAQAKVAATQNPFLMKQEQNLPVPEEPLPTLELLYHPEKRENFIDREALEQV